MADSGLEDFLAELENTPATPLHHSSSSAIASSSLTSSTSKFALDDELADIFGVEGIASPEVISTPSVPATTSTNLNNEVNSSSNAPKDDGDILSWLGDTPTRTNTNNNDSSDMNSRFGEIVSSSTTTNTTMDNFFDEVFGDTLSPTTSTVSKPVNHNLYDDIYDAVHSSFPDVTHIRQIIQRAGYIPTQLRGLVWCLLLTGGTTEDHEADYYHPTGAELPDAGRLNADVDALMAYIKAYNGSGTIDADQCRQNVHDILVLYCVRRQVAYQPLFCSLLAPMLAVSQGAMSRSLASSCFYSLATEFVPIINLKPPAMESAIEVLHGWLRLLVGYHSPKLAQYLDRVLLGWEQPSVEALGALESLQVATEKKHHAALDDLERELGLSLDDPNSGINSTWVTVEGNLSGSNIGASNAANKNKKNGSIPSMWIFGMFTGSLPPDQAGQVLDWVILENERFAGIYFIASLLELYSTQLLTMTSTQIKDWLRDVATGQDFWYQRLNYPSLPQAMVAKLEASQSRYVSWTEFVNGWIHATADLRRTTPQAFRTALLDTERWASTAGVEGQATDSSNHSGSAHSSIHGSGHGAKLPSGGLSRAASAALTGNNIEDEDDVYADADDQRPASTPVDEVSGGTNNGKPTLMDRFRRLSTATNVFGAKAKDNQKRISTPKAPQETKCSVDTISLWVDAAEVVPCLTSNRRRPGEIITVSDAFLVGVQAAFDAVDSNRTRTEGAVEGSDTNALTRGRAGVCFPEPDDAPTHAQPFYFGLDCRPVEERVLGRFPKAYVIDPSFLTDADAISALLEVLEPLATTVHLCIIGSGDEFTEYVHQSSNSTVLSRAVADANTRVNAVAHFFVKRGFKHVSILEGGFVAAARFLLRPDSSRSIASSLVDVDMPSLYAVLGIAAPAANTTTVSPAAAAAAAGAQSSSTNQTSSSSTAPVSAFIKDVAPAALNSFLSSAGSLLKKDAGARPNAVQPSTTNPDSKEKEASSTERLVSEATASVTEAKAMFSAFGKRMSILGNSSLESIKKSSWMSSVVNSVSSSAESTDPNSSGSSKEPSRSDLGAPPLSTSSSSAGRKSPSAFVIDDDDENIDDGMGPKEPQNTKIGISRTDQERAQALAMHKLAGLRKGDTVVIGRENLPGAILFPAIKYKNIASVADVLGEAVNGEGVAGVGAISGTPGEVQQALVHRFLVVTRERFLVLDSNGGGVGSLATVKSNHHLTELLKMTFKKKDPEFVTLYFLSAGSTTGEAKTRQYRVSKRAEFVQTLQKHMQRFK